MIKKVCLLADWNHYEVIRHFTKKLSEAFNQKGIETVIIDPDQKDLDPYDFNFFFESPPDFTCSFSTFEKSSNNKFLWDVLKTPHVAFCFSPAIYFLEYTQSPYTILTVADKYDLEAVQTQFSNTFFWPHAVEKDLQMGDHDERCYDVVFFGSCFDFKALRDHWQETLPGPLTRILEYAINIATINDQISLNEALSTAFDAAATDPAEAKQFFLLMFHYLDRFVRGKDRIELISAIKDVEVHIFGEAPKDNIPPFSEWHAYFSSQSNVVIHPPVSFSESFQILQQSKICLNSMPFFRNGSHERILSGLACGALPITSESLYLRETFKHEEDLLYYHTRRWEMANEMVHQHLENESLRQEIVARGREKVMNDHTWDIRVDSLLENVPPLIEGIRESTKMGI